MAFSANWAGKRPFQNWSVKKKEKKGVTPFPSPLCASAKILELGGFPVFGIFEIHAG